MGFIPASFDESNRLEDLNNIKNLQNNYNNNENNNNENNNNNKNNNNNNKIPSTNKDIPRHFRLVVGVRDGIHSAEAPLFVTILRPEELSQIPSEWTIQYNWFSK